jgi:hypothetical protein
VSVVSLLDFQRRRRTARRGNLRDELAQYVCALRAHVASGAGDERDVNDIRIFSALLEELRCDAR